MLRLAYVRYAVTATIILYIATFIILASLGSAAKSRVIMNIVLALLVIAPCAVCIQFASLAAQRSDRLRLTSVLLKCVVLAGLWWILFVSYRAAVVEIERVRILAS